MRGVDVIEVANDHIARNTIYYGGAAFARQVGLLPREGSLADRFALRLVNARSRLQRAFTPRRRSR
jgi:hypothetical protein